MLEASGWVIQDYRKINHSAGLGVAVREFPLTTGQADYLLFINRKAVGAVEAKPEGTTLSGVADQSDKYIKGVPASVPHDLDPLPFAYESTGKETYFRDTRDPDSRSRMVFSFHRPETLAQWLSRPNTLRSRLKSMPPLITAGLRDCQTEAITNLEESFAAARPRALVQMATGSGKTFTAVSSIYRLIKHADARRVLFLVDRNNLGRQTLREFQQYVTPDDGRKFTELYNVQHLQSNNIDPVNRVCITTIQRLYSMLLGKEMEAEDEERSQFDIDADGEERVVEYNPGIPTEYFDFIVTDECHRSIYHQWRQVLEYFDAFIVGLTATPSKQTLGFFKQNLVMEYSHDRAVADGVNVGFDVYRIKTRIGEQGGKVEAGEYVDKRNKLTRERRWELLDEPLKYAPNQLDRSVVAQDQIRTVVRAFRDKLPAEIFPGRKEVPKTLVFAKDDSHAEDIVQIIREEFGKGNDFCKKITYKVTGEKPENLIASFRNSYHPRIAVTVDMISTGTDIRPLECLLFMRDVRSQVYFEQMKGRGTRTISTTDLASVTPDAHSKTHFVIVDAVGVCENDKTDTRPLERKRSVPFERLMQDVAVGARDEATLSSLAGRLARLDRELEKEEAEEIRAVANKTLRQMTNELLDAIDPDRAKEKAQELFKTPDPTGEQVRKAREELVNEACAPFDDPKVRETIARVKQESEQVIDTTSKDAVLSTGFDADAKERAKAVVDTFKKFIEENRDELTALQIIYSRPYGSRHLTYEEIKQLAAAIERPPYLLSTDKVWQAYEQLDSSRVKHAGPQQLLTNVISLVRFAVGESDVLQPFPLTVDERYNKWLIEQESAGKSFTVEQKQWLEMIKDHIATSLGMEMEDFDYAPFYERGGITRASIVFGDELAPMIQELVGVLDH